MPHKMLIIFFFIIAWLVTTTVQSSYTSITEYGEGSDDAIESYGKSIGYFTGYLLIVGFFYVIFMRSYILIRKYVNKEAHPKTIEWSKLFYSNFRKPLFFFHASINIIAIFFGIYHAQLVEVKSELQANLGWLAIAIMITLSISGFIMYFKLRPIWNNKDARSMIRVSHRQWMLSFALIIILLIHVSFGEVH